MKEPSNTSGICKKHSTERLVEWQENNEKTSINIGDFVKLGFYQDEITEWMWVEVTEILPNNKYKGNLDNIPLHLTNIKCGDYVVLSKDNICQHFIK